ncbi:MAG: hypothetical protein MNPFHGCM_02601 [Gemmatimonadaceae bacterium]|nr:hypothetical protein [Gemmatimonadaceae bacterium]
MTNTRLLAIAIGLAAGVELPAQRSVGATPPIPNLAGKIQTVLGPVDPSTIGPTLMHEHIFIEFQNPRSRSNSSAAAATSEEPLPFEQPITMGDLYAVRYGWGAVRGTDFLGDFDEMFREVMEFRKFGGQAIVDVSSIGLGRDPIALVEMSNATGMSIVMGASWYTKQFHPLDMDTRTVEQLTDEIVRDVTVGVQGTTVRSGIIGEIGIDGGPLTPNELKVIRASARASRMTGAPMSFHAGGVDEERLTTIQTSLSEGVAPQQIIMGHSGALTPNMPLVKRILETGVYLQIDWLGVITGPAGVLGNRSDRTIAKAIVELIELGYVDRILLSHDICTKPQLRKYGGTGFAYVLEHFVPTLRELGVSEENIRKITIDNPRRALTFTTPR